MTAQFWKILTSDLRPPIQGGDPLYDGALPVQLPAVECDTSTADCGRGWNFVRNIETGFRIAGMWRTGRPNAVLLVEPGDFVERGDKLRSANLKLIRHATNEEVRAAIIAFSAPFAVHREAMAEEQWLWWQALNRPLRDKAAVEAGLRNALRARGLDWTIKEFPAARDAWDARAARDAWAVRAARDAWDARDAWAVRAARDAWAVRDAWDAWDARDARDAWDAWAVRAARDAWDAWAALMVSFAARSGWISHSHDKLTVGIRDAYLHGLELVIPTGPNELGWVMTPIR